MKTYSIEKSNGGTERVEGYGFVADSDGILKIFTLPKELHGSVARHVVAMYADKCWHSIKEIK